MTWPEIARRIVDGLDVQPGQLVAVRDQAGRSDVLQEILLAVELAGATPLPDIIPPEYLVRMLAAAPLDYLSHWDQRRIENVQRVDRAVVLQGADPGRVPESRQKAWDEAVYHLTQIEENRQVPMLLVSVPTEGRARQLGQSLASVEQAVLPALAARPAELQVEIGRVLAQVAGSQEVKIQTGAGHELRLSRAGRAWFGDDGLIDAHDRSCGACVSNLPGGAVYTTVLEASAEGSLWLPQAGPAHNVVIHFTSGLIQRIEAVAGAERLSDWLDRHSGQPRCIGHISLGLNPYLRRPTGWTLVDEHVPGQLSLGLGENRYLGGQNASSVNVDFSLPAATLLLDGRVIAAEGQLVV